MMNIVIGYSFYGPSISEEQPKTVKKIDTFGVLPVGWHYGVGRPANASTVARAKDIFNQYVQTGFLTTDAFPGKDGEIMVTGYKDNFYVECVVETDGSYSVVGERDKDVILESSGTDEGHAINAIVKIARQAWNIFASYTLSTSTQGETNLKALHLKTLLTTGQHQYYYADAWTMPRAVGALTSGATTYQSG
jgi:hypothetical protein